MGFLYFVLKIARKLKRQILNSIVSSQTANVIVSMYFKIFMLLRFYKTLSDESDRCPVLRSFHDIEKASLLLSFLRELSQL